MIPRSVLRRLRRVTAGASERNEPEELMEDFLHVVRAFEELFENEQDVKETTKAQNAVEAAIKDTGIERLERVQRFILKTKYFEDASASELAEWFGEGGTQMGLKPEIVSKWAKLRDALRSPIRWDKHDSRTLGWLMYRMRCGIVHPSLGTDNRLVTVILPRLRDALVEITAARAAQLHGVSFSAVLADVYEA